MMTRHSPASIADARPIAIPRWVRFALGAFVFASAARCSDDMTEQDPTGVSRGVSGERGGRNNSGLPPQETGPGATGRTGLAGASGRGSTGASGQRRHVDAANEDVVVKVDTQPIDGLAATTERDATVAAETGSADARSPDAGSPADAASTAPKFHVFLLLGQSNMAGYPKAQSGDKLKNPRIRVLGFDDCGATGRKANQWDVAVPPLHECWAGAIGPGDSFSQTLIEKLPSEDTIGLVPCALSGQAIEIFSKGTAKYDWIVERAQSAQRIGGVIEGFLFHQGESNCGNRAWPTKVKQLVSDLRTDLNLPNVPFIAGELPHDSACKVHNSLVNQLPTLIGNASVVSAQGLAIDSADSTKFHFSHDAQIELGKRYEAALIKALHW